MPASQDTTLLRLPEVQALTTLGKAAIYARLNQGLFPEPVRLSTRAVRWRRSDIDRWLKNPRPLPPRKA